MQSQSLPERVLYYLDRQIHWFELLLSDLASLDMALQSETLDEWASQHGIYMKQAEHILRENTTLSREWNQSKNLFTGEHDVIRDKARHAHKLQQLVQQAYDEAMLRIEKEMKAGEAELQSLKHAVGVMRKYDHQDDTQPDFLDRDA